jgi:hypothetical protein
MTGAAGVKFVARLLFVERAGLPPTQLNGVRLPRYCNQMWRRRRCLLSARLLGPGPPIEALLYPPLSVVATATASGLERLRRPDMTLALL